MGAARAGQVLTLGGFLGACESGASEGLGLRAGSAPLWEGKLGGPSCFQAAAYLWGQAPDKATGWPLVQALTCWGQLSESWLVKVEKGL